MCELLQNMDILAYLLDWRENVNSRLTTPGPFGGGHVGEADDAAFSSASGRVVPRLDPHRLGAGEEHVTGHVRMSGCGCGLKTLVGDGASTPDDPTDYGSETNAEPRGKLPATARARGTTVRDDARR